VSSTTFGNPGALPRSRGRREWGAHKRQAQLNVKRKDWRHRAPTKIVSGSRGSLLTTASQARQRSKARPGGASAMPLPLSKDLVFGGPGQIYFAGLVEDAVNRDLLHTYIVGARALAIIVSVNAGAAR
jgi:hypothetical protein